MTSVTGNTFDITAGGQFSEFGFSRIPAKGSHHHHMTLTWSAPSANTSTQRIYDVVGILDLQQLGPQIVEKFKLIHTMDFLRDVDSVVGLTDTDRIGAFTIKNRLTFTTSIGTELSALDKSIDPSEGEYTTRQYRLDDFGSSQGGFTWVDASNEANGAGAGLSYNGLATRSPFDGLWHDTVTRPLVVGPQLVILFEIIIDFSGNPIRFNTGSTREMTMDLDIITSDFGMTAEDIWFSRRLFNQEATNRLMYFRFVGE